MMEFGSNNLPRLNFDAAVQRLNGTNATGDATTVNNTTVMNGVGLPNNLGTGAQPLVTGTQAITTPMPNIGIQELLRVLLSMLGVDASVVNSLTEPDNAPLALDTPDTLVDTGVLGIEQTDGVTTTFAAGTGNPVTSDSQSSVVVTANDILSLFGEGEALTAENLKNKANDPNVTDEGLKSVLLALAHTAEAVGEPLTRQEILNLAADDTKEGAVADPLQATIDIDEIPKLLTEQLGAALDLNSVPKDGGLIDYIYIGAIMLQESKDDTYTVQELELAAQRMEDVGNTMYAEALRALAQWAEREGGSITFRDIQQVATAENDGRPENQQDRLFRTAELSKANPRDNGNNANGAQPAVVGPSAPAVTPAAAPLPDATPTVAPQETAPPVQTDTGPEPAAAEETETTINSTILEQGIEIVEEVVDNVVESITSHPVVQGAVGFIQNIIPI